MHYKEDEELLQDILTQYKKLRSESNAAVRDADIVLLCEKLNVYLDRRGDEPTAAGIRRLITTYRMIAKKGSASAPVPPAAPVVLASPELEFVRVKPRYSHYGFTVSDVTRKGWAESVIRATGARTRGSFLFPRYSDSLSVDSVGGFQLQLKGKGLARGKYTITLRLQGSVASNEPNTAASAQFVLDGIAANPSLSASLSSTTMSASVSETRQVAVTVGSDANYFVAKFVPSAFLPDEKPIALTLVGRISVLKITGPSGEVLEPKWPT